VTARREDLRVGEGAPARIFGPITVTDIVRYQGASGDMNPSHHDDGFARGAGFPGMFAPGLLGAGYLAAWATEWLGADNVRRFGVRFRNQVWPGDHLTCSGAVTEVAEHDGLGVVELDLRCTRGDGDTVLEGWATFVVA